METFLGELASELLNHHNQQLADICVVMPNLRAGIFLKKALINKSQSTILAPEIFSIEDFLTYLTGIKIADTATFLFELYEIHKTLEGENAQPLDQFIKTGQKMLADFNDVDKYLADPKSLFGYLSDAKALEKWNPDGSPLTAAEKDYLAFFRRLLDYYQKVNQRLEARSEAYQGMVYRKAAENIESLAENLRWKKIYFAGFNAFTTCEEIVIEHLRNTGKAVLIRDVDDYYISDVRQEAGLYLRKALAKEGAEKFGVIGQHFKNINKTICLHGTPGKAGQASLASGILNNLFIHKTNHQQQAEALRTAVVPADEQLLIPLLNALPENIGRVNVTMGYPLKLTPAYNFMVTIFSLYTNAERLQNTAGRKEFSFYYRDIIALLQQPLVSESINASELLTSIKQSKKVFYKFSVLKRLKDNWHNQEAVHFVEMLLTEKPPLPMTLLRVLETAVEYLRNHFLIHKPTKQSNVASFMQLEYLHLIATVLKRIRELNARFNTIHSIRALRETFSLLASTVNLPFLGEPLEGLQVMGMLETRNLDFERIIIISANEGILPANGKGDSFIPNDIRSAFNLPNHNHHNAVAAYHFYRLLQRASQVHIIYNTETADLGGGERSRFVQQLITEYPQYNRQVIFKESVAAPSAPGQAIRRIIQVQKDEKVFELLKKKAFAGFSPTSLNQFRRCSLQFYFRNIAAIKEAEEVEETIEHRTIGSIVHKVLEKLYEPLKSAFITPQHIASMLQKADAELAVAFDELYPGGELKYGRNRLLFEVIRNFVVSFLNFEKSFLETLGENGSRLKILDLEQKIDKAEGLIHIPENPELTINFNGSIDRVDELDGIIRIIDYKTGKVGNAADLQIKDWEDFFDGSKKDKPFQVLMYAWLYFKLFLKNNQPVSGGVIGLRSLSGGLIKFGLKSAGMSNADEMIDSAKLEDFETYLKWLFEQMFDREAPFAQTDNIEVCKYCDYNTICNR